MICVLHAADKIHVMCSCERFCFPRQIDTRIWKRRETRLPGYTSPRHQPLLPVPICRITQKSTYVVEYVIRNCFVFNDRIGVDHSISCLYSRNSLYGSLPPPKNDITDNEYLPGEYFLLLAQLCKKL